MTHTDNSINEGFQGSLPIRVIVGAMIALCVIGFFVFGVDDPDPAWGAYWRIRPLVVTPLAGAMGGLCNFFIMKFHKRVGVHKAVAAIISIIVFIIGLWLGIVVGLDGTMWD